ncbi:MAG: glycosyltransferase family 4 protein [Clostridia bacterium]|nr:glycosyltransferase family 4 protein [Clostridia bacterium]
MSEHKRVKILQVCAIDETVKSLLMPLIDRLAKDGFDVFSCCSKGKNSDELRKKGYKIENIEIARSISPVSNIKSIIRLYKYMKKEKFDVVHVHTPIAALLGRIAAWLAKVPVVIYTAHGFYFHELMKPLTYRTFVNIEKFAGKLLTDYIMTQSEEDRQTAIKEGISKSENILTIGNGVDVTGRFNPQNIDKTVAETKRKELGIGDADKVISFIGRMVEEKGIFELVKAFDGIKGKENYKLLLIGDRFTFERDTGTFEKLNQILTGNKNIIMAGRRTDIEYLLYISDLFILPSYREGMPRSIIEAMSLGKPVIATNIRGCREEVVDRETGFLVEVKSAESIREKILRILDNPEKASEMGVKARKRAEELFDEEKVLDKEIEVINRLIKK